VVTYKKSNKNLAIANRSRVSCAHNLSIEGISVTFKSTLTVTKRSLETEPLDRQGSNWTGTHRNGVPVIFDDRNGVPVHFLEIPNEIQTAFVA